jgi:predicted transcriptional regulator
MESFTTQDLIEELQQYQQTATPRREGGVTIIEWAEAQNPSISDTASRKQLKKLMDQGIIEREWSVCPDGIRRWVYYKK